MVLKITTDSLKDFVTKTTDPIALGKLKISAGVADQLHKNAAGFIEISG